MIEAGATDWCGHFGQSGRLIEEMKEFFDTVDAVCAWVEKNSSGTKRCSSLRPTMRQVIHRRPGRLE